MSRKAISVYSLMLSDFSMLLSTKCSADSVDLPLVDSGLSFFQSYLAGTMLGVLV